MVSNKAWKNDHSLSSASEIDKIDKNYHFSNPVTSHRNDDISAKWSNDHILPSASEIGRIRKNDKVYVWRDEAV